LLFLNTALLFGALGILIPIVIHLLNRRSNRVVDWGAMNFLLESLAIRNRRIQLEEALLMATRCLLVGLLALAVARPFIPPGSAVPWIIILPLVLLAVVGIGVAAVLNNEPRWRFWIGLISVLILLICFALVKLEQYFNLSRFMPGAKQDIALVIDGSTSMTTKIDGVSNFERAVDEARTVIKRAPRGHSFSLILGGPSPVAKILDPTTDRAELESALDDLSPVNGPMATYHALTLASLSLTRGDHPAKQIILITDEQNVGWEIGKTGRWSFLRDAFKNLPSEPQILLRKMPLPSHIRNIAVTDIHFSREIVGVDRPVGISVTVENTGDEAVTPTALLLKVDDATAQRDQSLGQLQPGEKQTVELLHNFKEPGAHAISATLEVEDDILEDNRGFSAINVASELKVLIVDGHPSGSFFERASSFAEIALAPSSLTLDPTLQPNVKDVSDEASDDYNANYDPTLDPIRFLVAPRVIPAPRIDSIPDFEIFDVILLADVPRLPESSARKIGAFVRSGGGLLVTAGQRVQPEFYNQWQLDKETPLLPARLADTLHIVRKDEVISPSVRTLTHPALQKIADASKSDFSTAVITNYRPQTIPDALRSESSVGARFNNGDIFLTSRRVGEGRVALLGTSLDATSGNLVTRQAFLPMIHELVYYLANPAAYDLNLDPGWEVNLTLTAKNGAAIGEGVIGNYYASLESPQPTLTRQDRNIQFNWGEGSPASGIPVDHFKVEWTGKIQIPETAEYTFTADANDLLDMWIGGKYLGGFRSSGGRQTLKTRLEGSRWYNLRAVFKEETGEARAILYWQSQNLNRQVVPTARLRSFSGPSTEIKTGSQSALANYEVIGPDKKIETAQLISGGRGSVFKLKGDISSGLYELKIPREQRVYFSDFLQKDSHEIPFTVKSDPAESHLTKLTAADLTFINQFVTLSQPKTLEELIGFLNGNQFGQELWKYLAVGALLFLLLEIALSRWIARSRRMGEEIKVKFESKDNPTDSFRAQLSKMGKAG